MRYAIHHTFPNGETLGDGYIHAGNRYPQPVAPFYTLTEAEEAAARMRAHNPGHTFAVVPYPRRGTP